MSQRSSRERAHCSHLRCEWLEDTRAAISSAQVHRVHRNALVLIAARSKMKGLFVLYSSILGGPGPRPLARSRLQGDPTRSFSAKKAFESGQSTVRAGKRAEL
jgi:hypothetical protein